MLCTSTAAPSQHEAGPVHSGDIKSAPAEGLRERTGSSRKEGFCFPACGNASDHSAMLGVTRPNPEILTPPLSALAHAFMSATPRAAKQSEPALGSENPSFQGLTALNHRGTRRPPGPVESRAPSALANRSSSGPRRSTDRGDRNGRCRLPGGWAWAPRPRMAADERGATHHHLGSASEAGNSPLLGLGTARPSPQCSAPTSPEVSGST